MPSNPFAPVSPQQFQGWASFFGGNVSAPQAPPQSAWGANALGQPPSNGQYTGGWAYPDAWANFYEGKLGFTSPQNQVSPSGALAVENYARNVNNPNDPNLLGWEQAYGNPQTILNQDKNWAQSLGKPPITGTISGGWQNPEAWAAYYGGTNGFTAPANAGSPASALAAASQIAKTSNPQDNPALLGWVADYGQPGSVLAHTPNWAASLGKPAVDAQGTDLGQVNTQGWDSPLAWAAFYGGLQGYKQPVDNTLQAAQNFAGVTNKNDPSLLGWELDYGNPQTVVSTIQASPQYQKFIAAQKQLQQLKADELQFAQNPQAFFNQADLNQALANPNAPFGQAYQTIFGSLAQLQQETSQQLGLQNTGLGPNDWTTQAAIVQQYLNANTNIPFTTAWQSEFGPPSVWFSEGSPTAALPATPQAIWTYKGAGPAGIAADVNIQNIEAAQYNALNQAAVAAPVVFQNGQPVLEDLITEPSGQQFFVPPGSIVYGTQSTIAPGAYGGFVFNEAQQLAQQVAQEVAQAANPPSQGGVTTQPIRLPTGQVINPGTPLASVQGEIGQHEATQQALIDLQNFEHSHLLGSLANAQLAANTPEFFARPGLEVEVAPGLGSLSNTAFGQSFGPGTTGLNAGQPGGALFDYGLYGSLAPLYGLEANQSAAVQAAAAEVVNSWNAAGLGLAGSNLFSDLGLGQGGLAALTREFILAGQQGLAPELSAVPYVPPISLEFSGPPDIPPESQPSFNPNVDDFGRPIPNVGPPQPLADLSGLVQGLGDFLSNLTAGWLNPQQQFPDINVPFITPEQGGATAPGIAVSPSQGAGASPQGGEVSPGLFGGEISSGLPEGFQTGTLEGQTPSLPDFSGTNLALYSGLNNVIPTAPSFDIQAEAQPLNLGEQVPFLQGDLTGLNSSQFNYTPPIDWMSEPSLEGEGLGIGTYNPRNASERLVQSLGGNWTLGNLARAFGVDPSSLSSAGIPPDTRIDPSRPLQPQVDAILANAGSFVSTLAGPMISAGMAAKGLSYGDIQSAVGNPYLFGGAPINITGPEQAPLEPGFTMPQDLPQWGPAPPVPPQDIPEIPSLPPTQGAVYQPSLAQAPQPPAQQAAPPTPTPADTSGINEGVTFDQVAGTATPPAVPQQGQGFGGGSPAQQATYQPSSVPQAGQGFGGGFQNAPPVTPQGGFGGGSETQLSLGIPEPISAGLSPELSSLSIPDIAPPEFGFPGVYQPPVFPLGGFGGGSPGEAPLSFTPPAAGYGGGIGYEVPNIQAGYNYPSEFMGGLPNSTSGEGALGAFGFDTMYQQPPPVDVGTQYGVPVSETEAQGGAPSQQTFPLAPGESPVEATPLDFGENVPLDTAALPGNFENPSGPNQQQQGGQLWDYPQGMSREDVQFAPRVLAPNGQEPLAIILHHTEGGEDQSAASVNAANNGRGPQFVLDRAGNVVAGGSGNYSIRNEDVGRTGGVLGEGQPALSNSNTVGIEIIGGENDISTQAQLASVVAFINENYPNAQVFTHPDVNPGHKQETEGLDAALAYYSYQLGSGGFQAEAIPQPPPAVTDIVSYPQGQTALSSFGYSGETAPTTGLAMTNPFTQGLQYTVNASQFNDGNTAGGYNAARDYGISVPVNWNTAGKDLGYFLVTGANGSMAIVPNIDQGPNMANTHSQNKGVDLSAPLKNYLWGGQDYTGNANGIVTLQWLGPNTFDALQAAQQYNAPILGMRR